MGALNIKNDEAHRLADQIAQATGESLSAAVVTASRARKAALDAADHGGLCGPEGLPG